MDSHRKDLRRIRPVVFLAIAVLVLLLGGWLLSGGTEHAQPAPVQQVETQRLAPRLLVRQLDVSGHWAAREEVTLMAPVEGLRVSEVLADVGERVRQGQVLARLERNMLDAQLEQSRQGVLRGNAELSQAQSRLNEAAAAYARARRLQPDGAISRQEFEAAAAAYAAARATRDQAQAALRQARAQVEETRIRFAHAEVRAPMAGLIVKRQVQVGALVNAQSALFSLVCDGELEFVAQIPASALADLQAGMTAQLVLPSQTLAGQIRLVGAMVDLDSGYGEARITVNGPVPPQLRVGAVGGARIELGQRQAMALDARALRYASDEQPYVFIVGPDGRVKRAAVRVGWRDGEWVEIQQGLSPQDRVVLAGAALLAEGEPVESVAAAAPGQDFRVMPTERRTAENAQP